MFQYKAAIEVVKQRKQLQIEGRWDDLPEKPEQFLHKPVFKEEYWQEWECDCIFENCECRPKQARGVKRHFEE